MPWSPISPWRPSINVGERERVNERRGSLFLLASMSNAVLKKYSCDHAELLTERISSVANDIETFQKTTTSFLSPSATMFVFLSFSPFFSSWGFTRLSLSIWSEHRQRTNEKEKRSLVKGKITAKRHNHKMNSIRMLTNVRPRTISSRTPLVHVSRNWKSINRTVFARRLNTSPADSFVPHRRKRAKKR